MLLRTIFRRGNKAHPVQSATALDEQFLRRLERLSLQASRDLRGGLSGVHASRRRFPAPTLADHRPYTPGDDVRYVDWNAYARLDHLQLKLGEAEQDVRVHLLLDCSASMDWGIGDTNKLHYARMLLAAIGYIALANGDRLQVHPFGHGRTPGWGPANGRQRVGHLLQYLQQTTSGGGDTIEDAIRQITRTSRGGLLVIASDLLHSGDIVNSVGSPLAALQPPRWQVLLFHTLHQEEIEPTLEGEVELVDAETGTLLPFDAYQDSVDTYMDAVERWCGELARACAQRQIMYTRLITNLSLERAVLPYLRLREAIR